MAQDYNNTLNLPKTDFPMRAGLPQREPDILKKWEDNRLYYKMIENNTGKPAFIFHDGPPYANASIHMGTALNKTLKDFIVRYKNMTGFYAPYVPGWDTHGLPIELLAIKELGVNSISDPVQLRKYCQDFALRHVEAQKDQFKRLGTLADYDDPYLTLKPEYEAKQIEIFGEMAKKGYIYKDLKSVYWCPECTTALAEAEIEYADDPCDSIYVKFNITDDSKATGGAGILAKMGAADVSRTYLVIWTTTTWTLPANLATCLGPDFEYVAVKVKAADGNSDYLIMAKELCEATMKAAGIDEYEVLASATGKELEYIQYQHPFLDRIGTVIVGDHVTLETGTGCVHTAPGHGVDDFDVVARFYPEIGCVVPVDAHGKMTEEAGEFIKGQTTAQANKTILEHIKDTENLFAVQHMVHQYPHCWRCKQPILFRATEQWFCSVEDFKQETLKEIDQVNFIPEWGKVRMTGMVADRNAWCISRQRIWGVPIPVFYCDDCGEYIVNDDTINAVAQLFKNEGSDAWYTKSAEEILPEGFKCPKCGHDHFTKEKDIMDVWFDSGVSHAAVLKTRDYLSWPADLYLEGADQYRGWFQSSLLTSVAALGSAPYKAVCTHGWVVDGEGRKMSKSLGNGMSPDDIVNVNGADILRLWVASSDYHADIRISQDIIKQLSEVYRKIRNTSRYILGNLDGFNPDTDCLDDSELTSLDLWAIYKTDELLAVCHKAYENYDFHLIYHALHNFCTIDMSNFYLDILKDRLYVEKADSKLRRAAQTTMWKILRSLNLLIAPILSFTAEEIWGYLPHSANDNKDSVMFNDIPKATGNIDSKFMEEWAGIIAVRDDVNKALELARVQKVIGKSLEAAVDLYCSDEVYAKLAGKEDLLKMVFIVSAVSIAKSGEGEHKGDVEGLSVTVKPAEGEKCERCWIINETVGKSSKHPTLCSRCADIIG